jgi:hypothetical protein
MVTLYNWRKEWRLHGEVVPASDEDPEGWGATDKFTVMVTIDSLLASARGGLDQSTASRNRIQDSYVEYDCLSRSRGVIFPGSHR